MQKKILITGGAGFLGSHICDSLIYKDVMLYCMDNLSTGRLENIKHLHDKKNFEFIDKSINDKIDIEVDEIYNFGMSSITKTLSS